jgi:hypothetical protein
MTYGGMIAPASEREAPILQSVDFTNLRKVAKKTGQRVLINCAQQTIKKEKSHGQ